MNTRRLLFSLLSLTSVFALVGACSGGDGTLPEETPNNTPLGGATSLPATGGQTSKVEGTTGGAGAAEAGGGTLGDGGNNGGTENAACHSAGAHCDDGQDCCSGHCNSTTSECAQPLQGCLPPDAACGSPLECCGLSCQNGSCSESQCRKDSESCDANGECCSGSCRDGACAKINIESGASCSTSGNSCEAAADCCSGLCSDGICSLSSSYCIQTYDVCSDDSSCCQGVCLKKDGAKTGYCAIQQTTGTRCGERKIAGEVCSGDCSECCSRTCAPYGPSGISICQPPTGCRTDGELCRSSLDCCGGDPDSTIPGAGEAECRKVNPDDEIGRCKVGACNPDGAICGSPEEGTAACSDSLSAPNGMKCCGTKQADWEGDAQDACVADSLLVPRCSTVECVEQGENCATSDDCCGGQPCVQDKDGHFVCHGSPGETCSEEGGPCSASADCCVGSLCLLAPGQATGVCGSGTPPTESEGTGGASSGGGGSDGAGGGSQGGGTQEPCAAYGQDCAANECCSDVPCDDETKTCRFGSGG